MSYNMEENLTIFFESSSALQASKRNLLKSKCEQERIKIFTILMLSFENPRLARYMLTGNRSMFLEMEAKPSFIPVHK